MVMPDFLVGIVEQTQSIGSKYHLLNIRVDCVYSQNPGQYCFLELVDKEGPFQKPYSIASEPRDDGLIELCLLKTGDPRTKEALERLQPGDRVQISPAKGRFHYPAPTTPAVFVAGGSGISPLRSMIRSRFLDQNSRPAVSRLLYGCEKWDEIPYFEEFQELAERFPEFQVSYYTSQSSAKPLHQAIQQGLPTAGLSEQYCSETEFFLCGPPPMMTACIKELTERQVSAERIFTDQY